MSTMGGSDERFGKECSFSSVNGDVHARTLISRFRWRVLFSLVRAPQDFMRSRTLTPMMFAKSSLVVLGGRGGVGDFFLFLVGDHDLVDVIIIGFGFSTLL
jgi:hypothetical protein